MEYIKRLEKKSAQFLGLLGRLNMRGAMGMLRHSPSIIDYWFEVQDINKNMW
jgi:hypothetical protein